MIPKNSFNYNHQPTYCIYKEHVDSMLADEFGSEKKVVKTDLQSFFKISIESDL